MVELDVMLVVVMVSLSALKWVVLRAASLDVLLADKMVAWKACYWAGPLVVRTVGWWVQS